MNKPQLKWSPAHPIRAKNNLISSAAQEKNQLGFKPTYETEPKIYMNFLMSNEYMKMWYKERGQYEKDIYSREETIKEESKIKRRVVQRMMTYRRPLKIDFIDDSVQKKKGIEPPTDQITIQKMKYRPDCHHKKDKHGKSPSKPQDSSKSKEVTPAKGTKGHAGKDSNEPKHKMKGGKDAEEDECDIGGELLLVCAENAENTENKAEGEDCKCGDNK